jgi:flagellar biosynthetic protein FliO
MRSKRHNLALLLAALFFAACSLFQTVKAQENHKDATEQSSNANPTASVQQESNATSNNEPLPFMESNERQTEDGPSAAGLMARTLGALLLIVGLIVAAGWGLRKFGGARFGATSTDGPGLQVLSNVAVGNNRSLIVAKFGERVILIGSTPQSFTLLATQDKEDELDQPSPARSVSEMLAEDSFSNFNQELMTAQNRFHQQATSGWTSKEAAS